MMRRPAPTANKLLVTPWPARPHGACDRRACAERSRRVIIARFFCGAARKGTQHDEQGRQGSLSANVPEAVGRQSQRDRNPRAARRERARHPHRRPLFARGPFRAAPLQGGRGLPDRQGAGAGTGLPQHRGGDSRGARLRRRCGASRIRFPLREPGTGRGLRPERYYLHWTAAWRDATPRQQGGGSGAGPGSRHCRGAGEWRSAAR